jgi:hypothetical protein
MIAPDGIKAQPSAGVYMQGCVESTSVDPTLPTLFALRVGDPNFPDLSICVNLYLNQTSPGKYTAYLRLSDQTFGNPPCVTDPNDLPSEVRDVSLDRTLLCEPITHTVHYMDDALSIQEIVEDFKPSSGVTLGCPGRVSRRWSCAILQFFLLSRRYPHSHVWSLYSLSLLSSERRAFRLNSTAGHATYDLRPSCRDQDL